MQLARSSLDAVLKNRLTFPKDKLDMNLRKLSLIMIFASLASCRPQMLESQKSSRLASEEDFQVDDSPLVDDFLMVTDETPNQLICRRRSGSALIGDMTVRSPNGEQRLGAFTNGHVGTCEMARRAARNGMVCLERSGGYAAVKITGQGQGKTFRSLQDCISHTQYFGGSAPEDGLNLIDPGHLAAYIKNLPNLEDPIMDEILHSPFTIWYDENSMVFTYQDSFGNPTGPEGLRANRVAYDVGSTASEPGIRALTEYFELQTFKYPFSISAGRLDHENSQAIYFWKPPTDAQGKPLPVIWWKNASHWHWIFPVGTVFGELLLVKDAGARSEWFIHEVRTRVRQLDHWKTDIFRPFPRATDFASSIKKYRPNWQSTDLKALVDHLENPNTLTPGRLDSKAYEKAVPSISGFYDYLPETKDHALIRTLLTRVKFKSSMNTEWKRSGDKVSFAPTTNANFHIVPKRYIAGLLENNEKSCVRCHNQTGRPLGQLDYRASLYGEIWGEDQIFTWHPFKPYVDIYSVSDRSRVANPRLVKAGLLVERKPSGQDQFYRELSKPYNPYYR